MIRASSLNTLRYDSDLCTGCEMCSIVCPHGVFARSSGIAQLVRPDDCMECGACELNCPTGAIEVESGVGCASAMIRAALTGSDEVICGDDVACNDVAYDDAACGDSTRGDVPSGDDDCCGSRLSD